MDQSTKTPNGKGTFWRYPWAPLLAPFMVFLNGIAGRAVFAPGDGHASFIPWFVVSARAWRSGHLPTWNPWAQAGGPHLAYHQPGALYPPNLLFMILSPVFANNIIVFTSFALAGLGAWLLVNLLCDDPVAAAAAGVSFGLSAFMLAHVGHQSMIAGAAWLPWSLYGFERVREKLTPIRLLVFSGAIALSILAGHSQIIFINLLALAIYAVVTSLIGRGGPSARPILIAGLGVGAGLALAAPQLLPTAAVAKVSVRSSVSYATAMTYSLPKSHLPLLLFPYLFGNSAQTGPFAKGWFGTWNATELSGYIGACAFVFAAVGVGAIRRDRRIISILVTMGICALLMVGPATPLSRLFFRLPIYGKFRAWARYVVVVDLSVAILAGYGVALLRRSTGPERRSGLKRALVASAAVIASALILPRLSQVRHFVPGPSPAWAALALPAVAAFGALVCGLLLSRGYRLAALATVALIALDMYFSFGRFGEWRTSSPTPARLRMDLSTSRPYSWGHLFDAPGGIGRYIFLGGDVRPMDAEFVHLTDLKQMRSVNTNNPLLPEDFAQAVGMTDWGAIHYTEDIWRPQSHILDLLRVTTVLRDPMSSGTGPGPESLLVKGQPLRQGTLIRYDYAPRLPEAFLVGAAVPTSRSVALNSIHGLTPFDPAKKALLDGPCPRCPTAPEGPAGFVESTRWDINSVSVRLSASRPAILVLSQAWSPGWQALIDGRPENVIRVDGLVQGIALPAGARQVVLHYRAPGLRLGVWISIATIGLFLAAAILSRRFLNSRTPK